MRVGWKAWLVTGLALFAVSGLVVAQQPTRGALSYTAQAGAPPVTLYKASKALVIGIDAYTEKGWPPLRNAVADAEAIAKTLVAHDFDVTLRTNLKSDQLYPVLRDFFIRQGADPEARLLLWFAGHGHTMTSPVEEGYLVPADAPSAEDSIAFRDKALAMRQFSYLMTQANAKHVLAVFDSCFSGTALDITRQAEITAPPEILLSAGGKSRQIISSGDRNQKVSDNGIFRQLFVDAISGAVPRIGRNGWVTGQELGIYLRGEMTALTARSASPQTPNIGYLNQAGFNRGDFVFGPRERAVSLPTVPVVRLAPRPQPRERGTAARDWQDVKETTSLAVLERFAERHKDDAVYGALAQDRIATLKRSQAAAVAKPAEPAPVPKALPPSPQPDPPAAPTVKAPEPVKQAAATQVPAPPKPTAPAPANDSSQRAIAHCRRFVNDPGEGFLLLGAIAGWTQGGATLPGFIEHVGKGCQALRESRATDVDLRDAELLDIAAEAAMVAVGPTGDLQPEERELRAALRHAEPALRPLLAGGHANTYAATAIVDWLIHESANPQGDGATRKVNDLVAVTSLMVTGSPWGEFAALILNQRQPEALGKVSEEDIALWRKLGRSAYASVAAFAGHMLADSARDNAALIAEAEGILDAVAKRAALGKLAQAIRLTERGDKNLAAAMKLLNEVVQKGDAIHALFALVMIDKDKELSNRSLVAEAVAKIVSTDDPFLLFALGHVAGRSSDGDPLFSARDSAKGWIRKAVESKEAALVVAAANLKPLDEYSEAKRLIDSHLPEAASSIWLEVASQFFDGEKGKVLIKRAAERARPRQLMRLAGPTFAGARDEQRAMMRRAGDTGDAHLKVEIAETTARIVLGVDEKAAKAEQWRLLKAAIASTDDLALLRKIADLLTNGSDDMVQDRLEATRLFKLVGEQTADPKEQLDLARRFAKGENLEPSREDAGRLYRKAATALNDPTVALEVAKAFGTGVGVLQDRAEAQKWLKAAEATTNPTERRDIAEAYLKGEWVPLNVAAAKRLLLAVAEAGTAVDKLAVARRLLSEDLIRDEATALQLMRAAAEGGNADALEQLTDMTERGLIIPQNSTQAADLALKELKARGKLADARFETWRTGYSVEFRRAVQTILKDRKLYTGAIDGTFGSGVKRALEAVAANRPLNIKG